jgi:hypothetical protein
MSGSSFRSTTTRRAPPPNSIPFVLFDMTNTFELGGALPSRTEINGLTEIQRLLLRVPREFPTISVLYPMNGFILIQLEAGSSELEIHFFLLAVGLTLPTCHVLTA